MFKAIDYFLVWTGNFGRAILIGTVLIKIVFLPFLDSLMGRMS